MSHSIARRDFLKCALASAAVIPALGGTGARAEILTPLDAADPTAQALGFALDASKVAASANPTFKGGQHCGVCAQYQGKPPDRSAGCSIYPGHSVPAKGWCRAFVQRT
jgi:hypothetical protein